MPKQSNVPDAASASSTGLMMRILSKLTKSPMRLRSVASIILWKLGNPMFTEKDTNLRIIGQSHGTLFLVSIQCTRKTSSDIRSREVATPFPRMHQRWCFWGSCLSHSICALT